MPFHIILQLSLHAISLSQSAYFFNIYASKIMVHIKHGEAASLYKIQPFDIMKSSGFFGEIWP